MSGRPGAGGRWYTHGWNRALSWRLIETIVPKLPRPLRLPLHAGFTALCFATMPRERRAARRNLERITGRHGLAAHLLALRLFYNFSKFLTGCTDLAPFRPEVVQGWVAGGPAARAAIESALAEGKGLITLTLHLGNYEIGLAYLSLLGVPIQVVMRPEEAEAARFQIAARARPGVTLVAAGDSEWAGLDLLLALRRGEIVAIQGDRAFGAADLTVDLFGVPLLLPAGPFRLAQASGAPILLVTMPIVGHWRYRVLAEGPLRVAPGEEGLRAVAAEFARRVEGVVARYPTQWFNFYDLWGAGGGAGPRDARGAALRGAPPAGR